MFNFNISPFFRLVNPPFTIIGQEPNKEAGAPGRIGFQMEIPGSPQIPGGIIFSVMFDRNQYEEFLTKLRASADVAKGVKSIGQAADELKGAK